MVQCGTHGAKPKIVALATARPPGPKFARAKAPMTSSAQYAKSQTYGSLAWGALAPGMALMESVRSIPVAGPYRPGVLGPYHILWLDRLLTQAQAASVMLDGQSHTRVLGEVTRALTSADLALLEPKGSKPPVLKKLRESHHSLARLVAEGKSLKDISEETGYSISRISILKSDPSFAELVGFYRANLDKMKDAIVTDHFQRAISGRGDYLEEIIDRLHDNPELLSFKDVVDGFTTLADRTGMGPQTKNTNLNFSIDIIEQHAAGRRRAAQLSAATGGPVYDLAPNADKTGRRDQLPPPAGSEVDGGSSTD